MIDLEQLTKNSQPKGTRTFASLDELRLWCVSDFRNFLLYSNSRAGLKTGKIQLAIADALQQGHSSVLIQAFRSSSKTWIIDNYIAWRWLRYGNTKILLLSAKENNASKHVGNIATILARLPILSHLTFAKRTKTHIQLSIASIENDTSLTMAGIEAAIEGSRADLIILDDCEVKNNSETQALRDKLLNRLSEVQAILHPVGRHCSDKENLPLPERTQAVYIGTPQTMFSVYFPPENTEEPHPLKDAYRLVIPALHNGNSTFPERWTNQQLSLKRWAMTTPEWALQMMLDPSLVDKDAAVIKYDVLPRTKDALQYAILTVDPAGDGGKKGSDEAAICVAGPSAANPHTLHVPLLSGFKGLTGEELARKTMEIAERYNVDRIIVESNLSGYYSLFRSISGGRFRIEQTKSHANKHSRLIDVLEPILNSGKVSFDPAVLNDKTNAYQFKDFKFGSLPKNDDRLDALRFAVEYFLGRNFFRSPNSPQKWESAVIRSDYN